MKNIHVLPTDKPSRLHTYKGVLNLAADEFVAPTIVKNDLINLNIYITSDEIIKDVRPHKGKWQLEQEQILNKFPTYLTDLSECKLVIMTTDQELIKDGVQAIDDEFLQWFVKNPSCEFVEVDTYSKKIGVETDTNGYREMDVFGKDYKIIIPQEEFKQMSKQTAVEWLIEEMHKNIVWIPVPMQEKAKEMEKEEIKEAVNYGCSDWGSWKDAEQYYNDTYKKEEK
jgi:vacuolar-type H+-ATPase subunit F/Vma7